MARHLSSSTFCPEIGLSDTREVAQHGIPGRKEPPIFLFDE